MVGIRAIVVAATKMPPLKTILGKDILRDKHHTYRIVLVHLASNVVLKLGLRRFFFFFHLFFFPAILFFLTHFSQYFAQKFPVLLILFQS